LGSKPKNRTIQFFAIAFAAQWILTGFLLQPHPKAAFSPAASGIQILIALFALENSK
jgi:hypothetical protein